jgi:hypothetical protein
MAGSILEKSRKKGRGAEIGAYLYALVTANLKAIQEVIAMSEEITAFDQWVEEMSWAANGERGEKNSLGRSHSVLETKAHGRGA